MTEGANQKASDAAAGMPWRQLMQFALGTLGYTPEAFWKMTIRELASAMPGAQRHKATTLPSRATLDALQEKYPDTKDTDT